jgi:hypothetical protein
MAHAVTPALVLALVLSLLSLACAQTRTSVAWLHVPGPLTATAGMKAVQMSAVLEERTNGHTVKPSPNDDDAGVYLCDRSTNTADRNLTVAMSFGSLGVPRYAKITNAYIQFDAITSTRSTHSCMSHTHHQINNHVIVSIPLEIRVSADRSVPPSPLQEGSSFNVTRRASTSAAVLWRPPFWRSMFVGALVRSHGPQMACPRSISRSVTLLQSCKSSSTLYA